MISFSSTGNMQHLTVARAAVEAYAAIPPRARSILSYWFGHEDHWATDAITTEHDACTAYHSNCGTKARIWWGGGSVDNEIRQQFGDDLVAFEKDPEAFKSAWLKHPQSGVVEIYCCSCCLRFM